METTSTPPPLTPPPVTSTSSGVRMWTVLCHAAALSGILFHVFGHVLGPLIVWLLKRGEMPEVDMHGKESMNFQLSMLIYNIVAGILCLVLIGFPILVVLWVLNIVFVVIASIKASEGALYRYPMTIRFLK